MNPLGFLVAGLMKLIAQQAGVGKGHAQVDHDPLAAALRAEAVSGTLWAGRRGSFSGWES